MKVVPKIMSVLFAAWGLQRARVHVQESWNGKRDTGGEEGGHRPKSVCVMISNPCS